MPYCAACGSAVEGRFCAKCGKPVGPPAGAGPPLADNIASALCYLLWALTGIIFLVIEPYNRNAAVRFHAFQSIFATAAVFAAQFALGIVLNVLPLGFFGQFLWLATLGLWLYLLVSAYQGRQVELPVVGQLARQQAGTN